MSSGKQLYSIGGPWWQSTTVVRQLLGQHEYPGLQGLLGVSQGDINLVNLHIGLPGFRIPVNPFTVASHLGGQEPLQAANRSAKIK